MKNFIVLSINKHMKNIEYIRQAIGYLGGEANTRQIYDWINSNTRNGIGSRQLPQVLKMGPFDSMGLVRIKQITGEGSYEVNSWRVKDNSY